MFLVFSKQLLKSEETQTTNANFLEFETTHGHYEDTIILICISLNAGMKIN